MLGVQNKTPSTPSIDIQDILYGGVAGEPPLPDFIPDIDEDLVLSGPKQGQNSDLQEEILSYSEAVAAAQSTEKVDIRPRIYDNIRKDWILIDTGSQCSVSKPTPNDTINKDICLEAVDGSRLPCYGTKPLDIRLGRKEYHTGLFKEYATQL